MGFEYRNPMTVASHRGDSYNYYENTMQAFEAAILAGCDMIETDIHMTKDGHLILMHDDDTMRTTRTPGKISDKTLDEMLSGKLAPNMKQYLAVFQNDTIPQAYGIAGQGLKLVDNCDILQ